MKLKLTNPAVPIRLTNPQPHQDPQVTLDGTIDNHRFLGEMVVRFPAIELEVTAADYSDEEQRDAELERRNTELAAREDAARVSVGESSEDALDELEARHPALAAAAELAGDDDEPEPERIAPDRDPQVPEEAWRQLNIDQKTDVLALVRKMEATAEALGGASTPTDTKVYTRKLGELKAKLHDEYGITLLPLDAIPEAAADEKPPPMVTATSPPVSRDELERRKRYLESRTGLPPEAAEYRDAELALIANRLEGGA